jgi:medium-chain acyl-[acyl-carrier-protein] hydrolase
MTNRTLWLAAGRPNPKAMIRLLCFPYAGGGESVFRAWPEGLPDSVEVCAVQLPGRGARVKEPPFTHLGDLVEDLGQGLAPYLDKPFAIFGHSMGALIGFELARRLRSEYGIEPVHLFVSGRPGPRTVRSRPANTLSDSEFLELLWAYNGTPEEALANPELMELMLPVIRADFSVSQSYVYTPEPPLDCAITAFGGLHDETISRANLEEWREHTRDRFLVRMLPGNHFFLNTERALLLSAISRELYQYAGH